MYYSKDFTYLTSGKKAHFMGVLMFCYFATEKKSQIKIYQKNFFWYKDYLLLLLMKDLVERGLDKELEGRF